MTSMKKEKRRIEFMRWVLLGIGLLLVGIPFFWIILTAFKFPVDAASVPPKIISPFTTMNFKALNQDGFVKSLWNSTVLTARYDDCHPRRRRAGWIRLRQRQVRRPAVPRWLPALQPHGATGHLHHPPLPLLP